MLTLLGGLLGGLFRLAPEIIKAKQAKDEMAHELAMQDKALEFEKLRGQQKMQELEAQRDLAWDSGAMSALVESIRGQSEKTGVKWVDGLSSLVRPIITFGFFGLYSAVKIAALTAAMSSGDTWTTALMSAWGEEDMALWAGILNFWFLGRVFDRGRN